MADRSAIEWTDATWNPIRARRRDTGKVGFHCEHVSEACRHCYAEAMNKRGLFNGLAYKPGNRARVDIFLDDATLLKPLKWKKPRRIFVCSMTDIFADFVTDAMLDRLFAVMALAPQHTLQLLTKRPARMREYMARRSGNKHPAMVYAACLSATGTVAHPAIDLTAWPLPNVWLGVTAEDQASADERIPELLATPAAVRFVSVEPMLGALDCRPWLVEGWRGALSAHRCADGLRRADIDGDLVEGVGWVICGGESGRDARPMHPDWARSLRDQCAAAGVPFFFKQWGDWKPISEMPEDEFDALYRSKVRAKADESQDALDDIYGRDCIVPTDAIGYGGARGHDAFFVVETPQGQKGGMQMFRVGKKRAGRLLDGREHSEFPR